jgi:precorrin-6B methylase 2
MDFRQIAEAVEAEPEALHRVLQGLAKTGILTEVHPGTFTLTKLGECLKLGAPGALRSWALLWGEEYYNAWSKLLPALQKGTTAFDIAYGANLYQYLNNNPETAQTYDTAMTGLAELVYPAVVAAHDFSNSRQLVDIGGGCGTFIAAILAANPNLRGILFDQPDVVNKAAPILEANNVADRCEIVAGDFFTAVPQGGDTYVLSNILHNWDDEQAGVILHNCRQAIAQSGRILIVETVLSGKDEPALARVHDLSMLVLTRGRERTEDEFSQLLARSGFDLKRVLPVQPMTCVVEAVPV